MRFYSCLILGLAASFVIATDRSRDRADVVLVNTADRTPAASTRDLVLVSDVEVPPAADPLADLSADVIVASEQLTDLFQDPTLVCPIDGGQCTQGGCDLIQQSRGLTLPPPAGQCTEGSCPSGACAAPVFQTARLNVYPSNTMPDCYSAALRSSGEVVATAFVDRAQGALTWLEVETGHRRQGLATELLGGLNAHYGRTLTITPTTYEGQAWVDSLADVASAEGPLHSVVAERRVAHQVHKACGFRPIRRAAGWVREHRPARRALRGVVKLFRPLKAIRRARFCCQR